MEDLLLVVVVLLCTAGVAFMTSSEASLISVNKFRIRHQAQLGNKSAESASRVVAKHEKFFATILLTENVFIILASVVGGKLTESYTGDGLVSVIIATLIMTVLIVTFGEITPKSLASRASERWSLVVARPVEIIMALESAITFLFTIVPKLILRISGGNQGISSPSVTEGELRMLIDMAEEEGTVETAEATMLDKVFHFGDLQIQDVMTPRPEIVWVEKGVTLHEFFGVYGLESHTRFPVFEEEKENIIGVLSVKDILLNMAKAPDQPLTTATDALRPAKFVPETKLVGELFWELRESGQQMAIVVDQFGGVAGLVTLKRLMEVVVGPVGEEGKPAQEEFSLVGENVYKVDAAISIQEVNDNLQLGLPEGNYQTLAGFVLDRLKNIPNVGESLYYKDLCFEVAEMQGVKIEQIWIRRVELTE